MTQYSAILLFGPTGSGKTPLGDLLERKGLSGRACRHFDFGARLRAVAEGGWRPPALSDADVAVVRDSLRTGALLEDENFSIAQAILAAFLGARGGTACAWVVLNGLPRHCGQARDVEALVAVALVIHLRCEPDVVAARIRANTGGDRAARTDDSAEEVARKIVLYRERTMPLLDHYAAAGVDRVDVDVTETMTPAEMWERLQQEGNRSE